VTCRVGCFATLPDFIKSGGKNTTLSPKLAAPVKFLKIYVACSFIQVSTGGDAAEANKAESISEKL